MNRSDLVKAVAAKLDTTAANAENAVDAVVGVIALSLVCDEGVLISGFGRFDVRVRPSGVRRNPRTGEKVEVAEKKTVTFHISSSLKKRLNGGSEES